MDVSFNQGNEINVYGTKFHVYSFSRENFSMKIYQCTECSRIYTSRTSFANHTHNVSMSYDPIIAHALLYTFVSVFDISLSSITSNLYNAFITSLGSTFKTGSRNTFKTGIKNFAKAIEKHNVQTLYNQNVYLLIDGAKKFNRDFEGVIAVTTRRLFLVKLIEVNDTTSLTIATELTKIVKDLSNEGHCHVISITSDNATNNIATFGNNFG